MRTTLEIPDPLFREVKARAAQSGLKLKELLTRYIEAGLKAP
jgi:predicted DNA binding CopG/RHH family protein